MARLGNGSSAYVRRGSTIAATNAFTCFLWYKNANLPGTASIQAPVSITASGAHSSELEFFWDHTDSAWTGSWGRRIAGGSDRVFQYPGPPWTADRWTAVACRSDGSTFSIWWDGAQQASEAEPTGYTLGNFEPCLLADAVNGQWYDDGNGAEFAYWNVALTDDEMVALGKGFSPFFIRPASRLFYWPLIRTVEDWHGGGISSADTTVADHPPVLYPRWAGGAGDAISDLALEVDCLPETTWGVFGPRTRRNRIERLEFARARRWQTYAADSFSRSNSSRLGDSDTGHVWTAWSSAGVSNPWIVKDHYARPSGQASGVSWAALPMGLADVKHRAKITLAAFGSAGVGLAFRVSTDGTGLLFHYDGSNYYFSTITSAGVVANLTTLGTTPVLALGSSYVFEVRAEGANMAGYIDGTLVGSYTYSGQRCETAHGIVASGNWANKFHHARTQPYEAT
jgi:hypothetical protein